MPSSRISKKRGLYKVALLRLAEKDLRRLPTNAIRKVAKAIDQLAQNPHPTQSKKLIGGTNQFRLRLGDYRLLYTINNQYKKITIYKISHRQSAYK